MAIVQKFRVHKDSHTYGDESDPHTIEILKYAKGPRGDMKFHNESEEHHRGQCKKIRVFKPKKLEFNFFLR